MYENQKTQPNWRPPQESNKRLEPSEISKMVKDVRKRCEMALKQSDGYAVVHLREKTCPSYVVHFVSELLAEGGTLVTLDWSNGNHVLTLKKGA